MKPQQFISPDALNRMLKTAEEAWERKDFAECIATLESASRRAPGNVNILLQLGRIHGLRYDYAAAERCFEKAIRLAPGKTEMLAAAAFHCEHFRNPEIAERYFRRALEKADASPAACVKLAELYERLRRLPEAAELVERALKMIPAYPAALLVRARLERQAGRLESAERLIRSFITRPVPDTWVHAQAWYELAGILDRQGHYDEAMSAFVSAKALLQPQAAPHLAKLKIERERLRMMQANISAEMLKRWFDGGKELPPARRLVLLCGHPRSGTTLLEQVLDSHPGIVSAEETDIFLDDAFLPVKHHLPPGSYMLPALEAATVPALQQSRAAYFRSMELSIGQPLGNRILVDKNPSLTFIIPAFVRIFPETKFLVALRDPRDVVLSCFMQAQLLNPVTAAYLELGDTVGEFAAIMSLWQTLKPLLPSPQIEVRYEDMVEDLESVARKTLDFLGVPWDDRVLAFDAHARKKMVRSPTYADVTQPVYKRAKGRWLNYQKYLEPHLAKLEPFVKAFGYE